MERTFAFVVAAAVAMPEERLYEDGTSRLPTDLNDIGDIINECRPYGFDVSNSEQIRMIAVLACKMIPRDQVVEIFKHVLELNEENYHESTHAYFTKKFHCSHGHASLTEDDVDLLIKTFGKEDVVGAYREKRKDGYCYVCGRVDGLRRCSKCKDRRYCSVDCQRKDWKRGHKKTCGQK